MNRTLYILLILIFTSTTLYAKRESSRLIFNPNIGLSVPYSDFSKDHMVYHAGFSSTGANVNTSLMWYWGKIIGCTASLGYSNMFFDDKSYTKEYQRLLNDSYDIYVSAGNYQLLDLTFGLILKTPEIVNTELLFNGRLGLSYSTHPELMVYHEKWGLINAVEKDSDLSIIGVFGFQINHYLNDKYAISAGIHAYSTMPEYKDNTSFEGMFYLPVNFSNVNIGLIINL